MTVVCNVNDRSASGSWNHSYILVYVIAHTYVYVLQSHRATEGKTE